MSGEAKDPQGKPSGSTSEEAGRSLEGYEETPAPNSPTDGQGSDGQEPPSGSASEVSPAPGTTEFQHPLLRGKTPEQIERLFKTQEDAIKAQNRELNMKFEAENRPQPSAPAPREEEADYGDDFMAPRFKQLESRLTKTLEVMVAPILKGQKKQENEGVRERLRSKFRHFETLEPHIDQLLREQGSNPGEASEASLSMLYHTAVGLANEQGIDLEAREAPAPRREEPRGEERPMNIPQHRPSGAPLPEPRGPKNQRPLTEEERRLAREYFPRAKDPEEEYRKYQDMDEEDVVTPGFSKEGW